MNKETILAMAWDEILNEPAGRQLDYWVAEKVMGMDMVDDCLPQLPKYYLPEYERTIFRDVPLYSSNISAAWEVVEKLQDKGYCFEVGGYKYEFTANVTVPTEHGICFLGVCNRVKTAPEAICKAALLAVLEVNHE